MRNRDEKLNNLVKGVTFGLIVWALIILVTGCSKKDSKSGASQPRYGYGTGVYGAGRPGYNGNGVISSVSAGIDNNGQYMLILALSTDPVQPYGTPAYVEGELHVAQPIGCPQMIGYPPVGLNPDIYQLTPYNGQPVSMIGVDFISNAVLVAQGRSGLQALVTVPYAKIFNTNVCGFDGMMGQLKIEQINGMNCGLLTSFTDQQANMCM